jgi:two-component sensor histidine kinase
MRGTWGRKENRVGFEGQLTRQRSGWLIAVLVAAGCVLAGFLARLLVDVLINGQVPFVTFYPAVMAASLIAGYRSGFAAVLLSTPFAIFAFGAQYPIMTTVVWLVLASVVALGCGLAHDLRIRLKAERDELARTNALAAQSAKDATNVEDYRDRLIERVRALSAAYSLMSSAEPDAPLGLDTLARLALAPFDTFAERLNIAGGPDVKVAPSTAIPISLCLHELATNAVKYGALSAPSGRVDCAWTERAPGAYSLRWMETGGPKVDKPRSSGFGTRLISAALNGVPGGAAVLRFEPEGVLCELAFNGA